MKTPFRHYLATTSLGPWYLLLSFLSAGAGAAQTVAIQPNAAQATTAECVRSFVKRSAVEGDSTALFYDVHYTLTPVACAMVRRNTHITAKGDFAGEVRDYIIATNRLRFRLFYQNGQRHGPYESYYRNGKLAVRGTFTYGEPTGSWEFWYANGQPKQTFEWTGQVVPRLRIIAAWDSTGQQGVRDGNGVWQGVMPALQRRYGGPVVGGLPQGIWESRAVGTGKLLTTEVYEQGIFQNGKALDAGGLRYKNHSSLEPQLEDPTLSAERISRGMTCEAIAATQQRLATQCEHHLAMQNALVVPPKPPIDMNTYISQILTRLNMTGQHNQWEYIADGQGYDVLASIDETGILRVVSGQGGSGIGFVLGQVLSHMARWHPATVDGRPRPGEARFHLVKNAAQISMSIQTRVL